MLLALFFISIGFAILYSSSLCVAILYSSSLCVLFLLCVDAYNRGNYGLVIAFVACLFTWFWFDVFVVGSVI